MSDIITYAEFGARLRRFIDRASPLAPAGEQLAAGEAETEFSQLALTLFALQFEHVLSYRRLCLAGGVSPGSVGSWAEIPAVPTAAFKEWEFTSLTESERTTVFYSSGTTGRRPSRHWHNAESLGLYEASLWPWFQAHCLADLPGELNDRLGLVFLTPPPALAPHSSLVHMFDAICRNSGAGLAAFTGQLSRDGGWTVDVERTVELARRAQSAAHPLFLLGAAFSFVHLLEDMAASGVRCQLPPGSRVLETGGYKSRSRALPKAELHALIARQLGIPPSHIVSEYGMCELSSQAYDGVAGQSPERCRAGVFRFPPWARALVVSPETGRGVSEGETGLLRVYDLANVRSALGIQTEDLAVRCQDGFELVGRAAGAEPRGCSWQCNAGEVNVSCSDQT
jgi:hypothetical protein